MKHLLTIRVKAIGLALFCLLAVFNAHAAVPSVPSISVPGSDSDGKYTVSWSAVANVTRYEMMGEMSGTLYSGSGRSSYRVKPNGTYYYKVRACNASGCSAFSGKKGITVNIIPVPSVPTISVPSKSSNGRYNVSWSAVSHATRYEMMGEMSGFLYKGSGRSSYRVKPDGTYYYKVRACNARGCSAFSGKKGITVAIIPGKASSPSASSMYQPINTNVSISWAAITNATSYKLYENGTVIYSGSGRSMSRRHSGYGRRLYTVAACNSGGCGAQSGAYPIVYYTTPGGVNNLAISASAVKVGESVTVSWTAAGGSVPGATYQVAVNGVVKASTTALNHRLVLTNAGDNQIRVKACNPSNVGCGSPRYKNVNVVPKMVLNKFEWIPNKPKVGQPTAFHWDIANAETCFATTHGPDAALGRRPVGVTANYIYTEPGVHVTKWYCKDKYGNRIPTNASQFLEATRTVIAVPPAKAKAPHASSQYQPIDTNVAITWPAVANATSYKLYENGAVIYTDSGLSMRRRHSDYGRRLYTVAACNSGGCGAQSSVYPVVYYTKPDGVKKLAVSAASVKVGGSVSLSWSVASGSVPGVKYKVSINGVVQTSTTALNHKLVLTKAGENKIGINACNPGNVGCGPSRYINVNVESKMQVRQFEWIDNPVMVDEPTAFHWNIEGAETCFATTHGPVAPLEREPVGQTDNYIYPEPEVHTTKWYCEDKFGNRIPEDTTQFLEATRIVKAKEGALKNSVVYKDGNGDLYVILSASHGSLALRIVGDDGDWDVTGMTLAALNNLELEVSDYELEYGNFAGDTREDFKLVLGDGWDDLVFQNNNNNYVYVQYEAPDDGTIGNIDANADGIRDDIAEKINKLFPSGNNKGYLEHVSFYTRAFLLDTDKLNKRRHYIEILKGYACLSASAEGEDAYAKIVGGHLDSQERFNRYISNQGFLKEQTLNVKSMDCVLNGTGVEEFSGCFITEPIESNDNFIPGGSGGVHKPTMMPGENVRLEVSAKHVRYDGNFDFSYYLNDVEQGRVRLHKSEEHTFIIDNYLFENDGYLKVKADNKNSDSAYVSFKVSCFEN